MGLRIMIERLQTHQERYDFNAISPYEGPEDKPKVNTDILTLEESTNQVIDMLIERVSIKADCSEDDFLNQPLSDLETQNNYF